MTAFEQLNAYLRRLEWRLRFLAASRGTALVTLLALVLTVALVWISNRFRFAPELVPGLRILLFASLAVALSFLLAIPLLRLNRRKVTRLAEQRVPAFGERLLTVSERPDAANPFTELVAEDALRVARENGPERLATSRTLWSLFASGAVATILLVWLIVAGPGYWGYGASLLWTGQAHAGSRPLYEVLVQPGDKTVRQKSNQLITAQLSGFTSPQVTLHAKYAGAAKWEVAAMQSRPNANGYQFLFAGLADPVEYYVQAGASQSKHYHLAVRNLPGVKRVRVNLHYPAGLGLKDAVEDPGGDIRAVEGSQADISMLTDRPLERGVLQLDNGSKVELTKGEGNWLSAHLPITKDGSYHFAALDTGEVIRISDDYFIEAKKDEAPSVKISRPGSDPRVTPIEEVPITVESADDFGVQGLDLHYSVNGGAEQVIPLLKSKGTKEANGNTMLSLENFKLVPGDVVSLYATAKDAKNTSRSDIIFAQAEPFDFKFSQSQQAGGGGGGGGGDQQTNISERQKQIVAATWNEVKGEKKNRATLQEDARFLADIEGKLSEQAKTLAERMASRELSGANANFENFSKLMTEASSRMGDAVAQLKPGKWQDALPAEQKALQSLLRAEAIFRDIQIAFQQGGGGGGGGGAQRDLARMFDLELDTSKNQYETGQSGSQSAGEQQKAIDAAFERLQALARRQQELASQNGQQQAFEQRWQEEQLRREAEELRRQMEQLARNSPSQQQSGQQSGQQQSGKSGQQQSGQQSASGSSSSSGSGKPGEQSAGGSQQQNRETAEALRESMNSLRRAEDEMRKAVSEHDATAQRRAASELAQAENLLNKALHNQTGNSVADLARKAQELADSQHGIANQMKQLYGQSDANDSLRRRFPGLTTGEGSEGMPEMNDPSPRRFYGYSRRNRQQEMEPSREPTEREKALATQKEKLAAQLEQLQRQMQQQGQSMAGTQPGASSQMRKALSQAEQKELALRMQKNAEWMRQGYGDRNMEMEENITSGVDQLAHDLRGIQESLKRGDGGDGSQPGSQAGSKESQALAQVRSLREQLERAQQQADERSMGRLSRESGQENGQSPGGQSPGGQSQDGQPQKGQAGGQGSQQSQQAREGQYGPGGGGPMISRRGIQSAIGDLNALRGQIDPRDRALRGYVDDTLGSLRNLNADPNILDSTISQDAVTRLERLEAELGRRLGTGQPEGARASTPEASPEKYREAVAEYFKKLSQPK